MVGSVCRPAVRSSVFEVQERPGPQVKAPCWPAMEEMPELPENCDHTTGLVPIVTMADCTVQELLVFADPATTST